MNATHSVDAIPNYLSRVQAGLKQLDAATQQEIISEIQSHLNDRADDFRRQGSTRPVEEALVALGDPGTLAQQFSEISVQRKASRSFLPWVLLRAAGRMAIAGAKGLTAFFLGLFGYATALAFFLAAPAKVLFPDHVGFWVGPNGVAWGALSNVANEQELAGRSFIYLSLIAAFLIGSATTLLLRWLLRPSKLTASILRRLR